MVSIGFVTGAVFCVSSAGDRLVVSVVVGCGGGCWYFEVGCCAEARKLGGALQVFSRDVGFVWRNRNAFEKIQC